MILAIISCVCSCMPIVGASLAAIALRNATAAEESLPSSSRGDAARGSLGTARIIAYVGFGLSTIFFILGLVLMITNKVSR